jgi:hypothetical protein
MNTRKSKALEKISRKKGGRKTRQMGRVLSQVSHSKNEHMYCAHI